MVDVRTVVLFFVTCILSVHSQDNIFTITPNSSICIRESVAITCYLFPPTAGGYTDFARLSFNGSTPKEVTDINNDFGSIGYVANVAIPVMGDSARIQLTITSFQVSDSNTVFGCHAQSSSDGSITGALENGIASLAAPPSPPMELTAVLTSETCSGSVELNWTPGASDRNIEMYFLSLNGTVIRSLSPSARSYSHMLTLQRDMEYTYSVVAMSCAGSSTETNATSISVGNPPSSPNVTLSQTDTSCSNLQISWSTPSSDRSILTYSVYRDDTFLTDATDNQYTDNTQLSISTEYEYSVVAISCAGTSTAGVNYTSIGGFSISPPSLRYDTSDGSAHFRWNLIPNQDTQPISIDYLLTVYYTYTQDNSTSYNISRNISRISDVTELDIIDIISQRNLSTNSGTFSDLRVCIQITGQCGGGPSGETMCASYDSDVIPVIVVLALTVAAIIGISFGAGVCCCLLMLVVTIIIIVCCVSMKKDSRKSKSSSVELEEQQMYSQVTKSIKKSKPPPQEGKMEGFYADIDHMQPKPDTLKKIEPVEETLYSRVQPSIDGPSQ